MAKLSRIVLVISLIILLVSISLITLHEKERFTLDSILYYRISDVLDYTKGSLDAAIPLSEFTDLIVKTDKYDKAELVMFDTLNRIDILMNKIQFPKSLKYVYGLAGSDALASKSMLAITLRTYYDDSVLETLIPKTYVMENGIDMDRWLTDTRGGSGNIYIMKKNVQRQEGFLITSDRETIINGFNPTNDYVVCQELLQNPLIVGEAARKVNMRIYLLVVVWAGGKGCNMYMYNDGFMYYTPAAFKTGSILKEENITTGYIDRQVYIDNPLTIQDLLLGIPPAASNKLWNNIVQLMETIAKCYKPSFVDANKTLPGTKFLIYGCDIAPSDDYKCKLMEVNKGPDLSYKDERDGHLKKEMVAEALSIVGIGSGTTTNFIKII